MLLVLPRDYFNSSNLYTNSELPRNQIYRRGVRVKKENKKFTVVSGITFHKTLNVAISLCCFAEDVKEMYQNLKERARRLFFLIEPFV